MGIKHQPWKWSLSMLILLLFTLWAAGCSGGGFTTTSGTLPGGPQGAVNDAPDIQDPAGWNGGLIEIVNGSGMVSIPNFDPNRSAMFLLTNLSDQNVNNAQVTFSSTQNPDIVSVGGPAPEEKESASPSRAAFDLASWQQRKLEQVAKSGLDRSAVLAKVPAPAATFWVIDDWDQDTYVQVPATLKGTGTSCYIYVDDNVTPAEFTAQQVLDLISLFDNDVYSQDRAVFGTEWKPGIDNEDPVFILVTKAWSGQSVAGYFSSEDEVPNGPAAPHSNEREIFYVDYNSAGGDEAGALLAHEFQHMINYNQRFRLKGVTEDSWLNEGLSMFAEDVCGFGAVSDKSTDSAAFILDYLNAPELISLTVWTQNNAQYGASLLFVRYLWEKYGGNALITRLMTGNNPGAQNCADAAGETFNQLFVRWAYMNFFSGAIADPYFNYTSINIHDGTYAGVTLHNARSFALSGFPSTTAADYKPYSARYFWIYNQNIEALTAEFVNCTNMGIYDVWK